MSIYSRGPMIVALLSLSACGGSDAPGNGGLLGDGGSDAGTGNSTDGHVTDAARPDAAVGRPAADAGPDASKPQTDAGVEAGMLAVAPDAGVDCSTGQIPYCIAGGAVRDRNAVTCVSMTEGILIGQTWTISCTNEDQNAFFEVEFPVQAPGPINLTTKPGLQSGLAFGVKSYDLGMAYLVGSMTEASDNLTQGTLVGAVGTDKTLTGTLNASWSSPGAACKSGDAPAPCKEGAVKLTFRVGLP